jgi:hypothetical protein
LARNDGTKKRGRPQAASSANSPIGALLCSCMNNKMSSEETLSITAWEKSHPAEVAACDKESGWK